MPIPKVIGRSHLVRGLGRELAHRLVPALGLGEPPHDVLDEDHGAVDDQAEVDRAEAHEVRRDARLDHPREGEEHRERDRGGDDEAGAHVARGTAKSTATTRMPALEQVRLDRADHAAHEVGPVVDTGRSGCPSGRRRLELLDGLAGAGRDLEGVLAREHLDEADDGLAVAVRASRRRSGASRPSRTCATLPTVTGVPSGPAFRTIFSMSASEPTRPSPADDVLLPVVLDVAAARVRVAPPDGLEDLLQGEAVGPELRGIDDDLVLLRNAAPGVDLGDARHRPQPRRDRPSRGSSAAPSPRLRPPSTVNWKTSPRPVVTGPISGLPRPGGIASRAWTSRSSTSWRAK